MVKLTNGVHVITVPTGAASVYERTGFHKVDKEDEIIMNAAGVIVENLTEENKKDDAFASLLEKPISRWTKDEVRDFAAAKGINLSGAKTFNDAKDKIKTYLNELDKNSME